MIDLYTWTTPNGRKASIMLEEIGLPYKVHPVNLGKQEQFAPEFLEIAPNNKIPAIVDHDAPGRCRCSKAGAILVYLAEKTGKLLRERRRRTLQGARVAQLADGRRRADVRPTGVLRHPLDGEVGAGDRALHWECRRLLGVIDRRLQESAYLAGDNYSIADVATYPWMQAGKTFLGPVLGPDMDAMPAVNRWLTAVGEREAVKRGMAVPKV